MLLSKGKIFSAMAGLAMLALPVSAFAGHRQDNRFAGRPFADRPFIAHDRGFHNGWFKPGPPVRFAQPIYRQPGRQFIPVPRPIGWNNEWREEAEEHEWHPAVPPNYWARRRFSGPAYGCDADGDDCRPVPNYRWRSDYPPQYQPSYENEDENENYGGQPYSWYTQSAPAGYNLMQRRDWLIARRQNAMAVIAQLRARGDSRGAARMVRAVNSLTAQINAGYGYNGGYNYAPSSYAAPSNYATPVNPLLGALTGNAGYYGAPNTNPALTAVGTLIGPMLGIQ